MIVGRLRRVRSRWRELQATAQTELPPIAYELRRLHDLAEERRQLSRPHRLVWRWYRHPLTQAVVWSRRLKRARLERTSL